MVTTMDGGGADSDETLNYKQKYRNLKRKLKLLIYENECFQEELRKAQRKLLKVSRDKSFLLDRLLQHEKVEASSSDSDNTESSDAEADIANKAAAEAFKKRKSETTSSGPAAVFSNKMHGMPIKRRKTSTPRQPKQQQQQQQQAIANHQRQQQQIAHHQQVTTVAQKMPQTSMAAAMSAMAAPTSSSATSVTLGVASDGHMTPEEVERHLESRHLESRHHYLDLLHEKAPLTVPNEMFSNEASLDSDSNEVECETSPSNLGDDSISIDIPE